MLNKFPIRHECRIWGVWVYSVYIWCMACRRYYIVEGVDFFKGFLWVKGARLCRELIQLSYWFLTGSGRVNMWTIELPNSPLSARKLQALALLGSSLKARDRKYEVRGKADSFIRPGNN